MQQRMKKISVFFAFFAAMAVISACNKDIETVQQPAKEMTISVSIPDDGLTKVALEQDATDPDGVIKLAWEATDVITVKNAADESKAVVFSLKDGEGTKSATFTSTDASALDGATAFDIYLTSNLPDDCSEQTQAANGSTSHLGYYATLRGVNKFDGVTFSQAWATANGEGTFASSAYLRIRAKMPSAAIAAAVQKVTLKASAEILAGSDEMEITITKPGSDDDIVTVYATLTPESVAVAEGTGLMVQFQVSSDAADKYTAYRELSTMTIAAGKVNAMNINCVNVDKFANDSDVNIGKEANPYLIGDRHQMGTLKTATDAAEDNVTTYFILIDDIDMSGESWAPVNPTSSYNKVVNLDGNNKTISNLDQALFYVFKGSVNDLTLDKSTVKSGSQKGVLAQYIQGKDNYVTNVDVTNVTAEYSANCVGGLIGRINGGVSGSTTATITYCDVDGVSVSSPADVTGGAGGLIGSVEAKVSVSNCTKTGGTITGANKYGTGGLIGKITGEATIYNCSAQDVVVQASSANIAGGLVGNIAADNVSIDRCFTTGTVKRAAGGTQHLGGLVGCVQGKNVQINNCYSSCTINGYSWVGGLIGSWWTSSSGSMKYCYASGDVDCRYGYAGEGGVAGTVRNTNVRIEKCIAWNGLIKQRSVSDYSSGAVVGYTHPNCYLIDNYRMPGMTYTNLYWAPSEGYSHPNVEGTTHPLVRIGTDNIEANAVEETTLTDVEEATKTRWAYHGKVASTAWSGAGSDVAPATITLSALAQRIGWDASIWDFSQSTPRLKWTLSE